VDFVVVLNHLSAEFIEKKTDHNTLCIKCNNIVQPFCLGDTAVQLVEGTDYDTQPTSGFMTSPL